MYWKYLFDKDYNIKSDGTFVDVDSRDDFGMEIVEVEVLGDNEVSECTVDVKHVNIWKLWELMKTPMNNIDKIQSRDAVISIGKFLERAWPLSENDGTFGRIIASLLVKLFGEKSFSPILS